MHAHYDHSLALYAHADLVQGLYRKHKTIPRVHAHIDTHLRSTPMRILSKAFIANTKQSHACTHITITHLRSTPMRILSKAWSSMFGEMMSAPSLAADRAASFTRLLMSAPLKPAVQECACMYIRVCVRAHAQCASLYVYACPCLFLSVCA